MFGMGMPELLLVLLIGLLVFGTKRLPELGSGLGKAIRGFKAAAEEGSTAAPLPASPGAACSHCGKVTSGEAAFCPQCGTRLQAS